MTSPSNDDTGKNLDTFLVAFHDFGMDAHGIAHAKIGRHFPKMFRFNFIK